MGRVLVAAGPRRAVAASDRVAAVVMAVRQTFCVIERLQSSNAGKRRKLAGAVATEAGVLRGRRVSALASC